MSYESEIWEKLYTEKEWGKYPPMPLIHFMARNFYQVEDRNAVKVLELGCGPGANLWYLAREGFKVYAIEGSDVGCKRSEKRLKTEGLDEQIGEIICGDFSTIPYPDSFFDAIIDIEALYCNPFDQTEKILQNAYMKLKPGGHLFSLGFAEGTWGTHEDNAGYHACKVDEGPIGGKGFCRYLTREDIDQLYQTSNTRLQYVERYEHHINQDKVVREWAIDTKRV